MKDSNTAPRFTVDKTKNPPVVWLHCSQCNKRLRTISMTEKIDVRRGYYCKECDDGSVRINIESDD